MNPRPLPSFVEGPHGRLFCIHWEPVGKAAGTVLLVPPFAEEMNRCRRTMARFCRGAAMRGWHGWMFDLHGTGDSEGDFGDASWKGWLEDLTATVSATGYGVPRMLVGFRSGALLASQWLAGGGICEQLVLWQPVCSGRAHLQQFLRLRVMASRFEGKEESIAGLEQEITETGWSEVAGYRLPRAVAEGMKAVDLAELRLPRRSRVLVLEAGGNGQERASPVVRKALERWGKAGVDCQWRGVKDVPCWSSQETVESSSLVQATLDELVNGITEPSCTMDHVADG